MPRRRVIESSSDENDVPTPSPAKKRVKRSPGAKTPKPSVRTKKPKKTAKIEFDPKEASDVNLNENITTVLTRLGKEEAALGNRWPSISLMKASKLISKLPFKLTSGSQASVYKGIGDKIEAKIDEIIESGDCKGAHSLDAEAALEKTNELMQVYGMSATLANELVSSHGVQSIDALYSRQDLLDEKTKIGLKYFKDFKAPIPKAEADEIVSVIQEAVKQKDDSVDVVLAGDFRRGLPESDEIVILLAHDQKRNSAASIEDLFAHFHSQSFFTETISSTKEKYIAVVTLPSADASTVKSDAKPETKEAAPAPKAKLPLFSIPKISSTPSAPTGSIPDLFRNPDVKEDVKVSSSDYDKIVHASTENDQKHLHRRVRFQVCSRSSLPTQLLYHTGPMEFWHKMQTQASSAGYVLGEKTLRTSVQADMKASDGASPKHKVGSVVQVDNEREVFEKIAQDYVEPSQRQSS